MGHKPFAFGTNYLFSFPTLGRDPRVLQAFLEEKHQWLRPFVRGLAIFSAIVMTTLASKRIIKKKGYLFEIYIKLLRQQTQD